MNAFDPTSPILVIALSGRMLASMLRQAGYSSVVVDCFGDIDTPSQHAIRVTSLALSDIQVAVEHMIRQYAVMHFVYGSGFESQAASLSYLENRLHNWGNSFDLFSRFLDKPAFFSQLCQLDIPHPQTVFSPPQDGSDWLTKPLQGCGGTDIRRFQPGQPFEDLNYYWQRYQPGEVHSLLFSANRGRIQCLGFNQQWTCHQHVHEFVFAGVANQANLAPSIKTTIQAWLTRLIRIYPLQGLGSLDFIVQDDRCFFLEINPRIPASAQLYGPQAMLIHLASCAGQPLEYVASTRAQGYQIVYLKQDILIPQEWRWPNWVVDQPAGGAFIGKGQPVCSIIAGGKNADQVRQRLQRLKYIFKTLLLTGLYPHAISGERQ